MDVRRAGWRSSGGRPRFWAVPPRGWGHWKHPEFGGALKLGKKEADERMERSLYQRGLGYSYNAVKIFMPAGAKKPIYAPYVEHVPPDTTSAIFWLKNRDLAHWRDAWQFEHVTGKYLISDKPMCEEQWIKERAIDAESDRNHLAARGQIEVSVVAAICGQDLWAAKKRLCRRYFCIELGG